MRERIDGAPEERQLLRVPLDELPLTRPDVLPAGGMSIERQQTLYTSIRPFVREDCQDITCPRPTDMPVPS